MEKLKKSLKYLIFSSLWLFIIMDNNIFSCGPYFGWEEDTLSFFEHTVADDKLFYRYHLKYSKPLEIEIDNNQQTPTIRDANIEEWQMYFKDFFNVELSSHEIYESIYRASKKELITALNIVTDKNRQNESNIDNIGIKKFIEIRDKNNIEYLLYIKELNPALEFLKDRYGWSEPDKDNSNRMKVLEFYYNKAVEIIHNKNLNSFLSAKYAFQSIRLAVFLKKYDEAIDLYNKNLGNTKINSLIRYRALGYKARALLKKGDKIDALKYYLMIFDQCSPLMEMARLSISFIGVKSGDWGQYIEKQKSDHRKTVAYFVQGLNKDYRDIGIDIIDKILISGAEQIKPEILLVRAIHKIEKYHLENNNYVELIGLCEKAGRLEQIRQPALWYIAGAYLSYLQNDIKKAEVLYKKAIQKKSKNLQLNNQIHLIKTLIEIKKADTINTNLWKRIHKDINWASILKKRQNNNGIKHSLWVKLGEKFLGKGDIARTVLCFVKAGGQYGGKTTDWTYNRYYVKVSDVQYLMDVVCNDKELLNLENIFNSKNKYDKFLVKNLYFNKEDVLSLRGIKEFRNDNLSKAMGHFNQLPLNYPSLIEYSESNPDLSKNIKYNELPMKDFVRLLNDINENIEKLKGDPKELAKQWFMLGNIYYSIRSGFPQISRIKKRKWGVGEWGFNKYHSYRLRIYKEFPLSEEKQKERYENFIISTDNFKKAEKYYKKIIELNSDKELAAKCCILMNTAKNNFLFHKSLYGKGKSTDINKLEDWQKKYFLLFINEYNDTQYYSDYIKQCPILKRFK